MIYNRLNFSLDPNEDPATGLERVSSYEGLTAEERRLRRIEAERELAETRCESSTREEEAALSSCFESLNYEIVDSELYRSEENETDYQVILALLIYVNDSVQLHRTSFQTPNFKYFY